MLAAPLQKPGTGFPLQSDVAMQIPEAPLAVQAGPVTVVPVLDPQPKAFLAFAQYSSRSA